MNFQAATTQLADNLNEEQQLQDDDEEYFDYLFAVEGEDDDPTTNNVSATTDEDTAITVNLDATEIDGDNFSFSIISQPSNGTLGSINGNGYGD